MIVLALTLIGSRQKGARIKGQGGALQGLRLSVEISDLGTEDSAVSASRSP